MLSASKAVEENKETTRDLEYLRGRGTSLGGLRPKCSLVDADGSLAIGKFPSVKDTRSVVHGEVLALNLAKAAGINAAAARVVDSAGVPVAVVTRFDRLNGKRLMYLSARSLMDAAPAEQYSYVDIADTIRMYGSQAAADLQELWRRLVFNILINNVDDHLNNHGFLHHAFAQWKLAPAFDLNRRAVTSGAERMHLAKHMQLPARTGGVPPGTIAKALRALQSAHIITRRGSVRGSYRLDDPVFAEWIRRQGESGGQSPTASRPRRHRTSDRAEGPLDIDQRLVVAHALRRIHLRCRRRGANDVHAVQCGLAAQPIPRQRKKLLKAELM